MKLLRSFAVALTAVAALAASAPASAAYPEKTLKVIVPYSPGGTSDTLTRLMTSFLEKELGQSIAIVNINGAGGAVGWGEALAADPDGYTLTVYSPAMPLLEAIKSATFKQTDFDPVAMVGNVYLTVTAKGDGPFTDLGAYKAAAMKAPGKVGLAMGRGTLSQFVAAMVAEGLGVDLKLVNAGGGAQKKAAVLGGHVEAIIEPTPGVLAMHNAGQLRILAVLSEERLKFAPDLPTAREQGVDVVAPFTQGFLAPKGTPKDRIEVLSKAVAKMAENPAFIEKAATVSLLVQYGDAAAFAETMGGVRNDILRIGKALGY